jgi:hypothetical protein
MEELRELRQREMEYEVQILRFNPKSLADTGKCALGNMRIHVFQS